MRNALPAKLAWRFIRIFSEALFLILLYFSAQAILAQHSFLGVLLAPGGDLLKAFVTFLAMSTLALRLFLLTLAPGWIGARLFLAMTE